MRGRLRRAGNLLVERMAGAEVHLVTKEEYTSVGSAALGERLAEQLRSQVHDSMAVPHGSRCLTSKWLPSFGKHAVLAAGPELVWQHQAAWGQTIVLHRLPCVACACAARLCDAVHQSTASLHGRAATRA